MAQRWRKGSLILEKSVKCEKDVQDIDVHSEVKNSAVTLLVMSLFLNLLGALRACTYFHDSTDLSRLITPNDPTDMAPESERDRDTSI